MSLFDEASLIVTPNAYKEGKIFAIKPNDGSGDLSVVRATTATRVNSAGLIETVSANVPRLDYTNSTCPSILVEPQRTNSFTNSEGINNYSTLGRFNCTYSLGSGFNSFGSSCRVNFGTFTNNFVRAVLTYNAVLGINNVFSLHFKKKTGFFVEITHGNASNSFNVRLNLETGQFISARGTALNNTFVKQLADDCFRVSFLTSANSTTVAGLINISYYNNSNFNNWTNSDANDFALISAIQWENNVSNATSYIPTVASAVTRNADVISKTGISDLIGQTEGTLYVEIKAIADDNVEKHITISDGTNANRIDLFYGFYGTGKIYYEVRVANSVQGGLLSGDLSVTSMNKIACVYKTNRFELWINGNKVAQDLIGNTFSGSTLSKLETSLPNGTMRFFGNMKSIQLYKTALTDQQLIELTAL